MSWLFSRALVEEYLVGTSLAGEQFAQLNENLMPQAYLSRDRMTAFSRLSRFGMTFAPLTESHGAELLMSYLAASHARTSVLQVTGLESRVHAAVYGRKWHELLVKWDHVSFSWKTAQCSLVEDLDKFSGTWPNSGSMRNGGCYLQPMLAPRISGKDCGSLDSTPTKVMPVETLMEESRIRYLESGRPRKISKKGTDGSLNWAQLMLLKEYLPTPKLCEYYMGFPIGSTGLQPLEMPKFLEWQQQHSLSFVNVQVGKEAA